MSLGGGGRQGTSATSSGFPPGRAFTTTQMNLERMREGRICEHWRNTDELGMLRQLGVIEA